MEWYFPQPNMTAFINLLTYANTVTNDMYGILTLISVFFISFLAMRKQPFEDNLTVSSLITSIVSYLLAILGLFGTHIILYPTTIFLFSIFLLFRSGR